MRELIVCTDSKGVIGNRGTAKLLWYFQEELKIFKKLTIGKTLIMGENTYISLPVKTLEKRLIVVLTKNKKTCYNIDGKVETCYSVEEVLSKHRNFIVCGGASIYKQFEKHCNIYYISRLKHNFHGNLYFPIKIKEKDFGSKKRIFMCSDFCTYKYIKKEGV